MQFHEERIYTNFIIKFDKKRNNLDFVQLTFAASAYIWYPGHIAGHFVCCNNMHG